MELPALLKIETLSKSGFTAENDDFQNVESLFLNCSRNSFRFDFFIGFPCQRVPMDMYLGGGFKHFCFFTPIFGEMIQFDLRIFFSNGLVQPQPPTGYIHI